MNTLNMKKLIGKNGTVQVRFKNSNNKLSPNNYTYFIPDFINPEQLSPGTEVIVNSPYNGLTVVVVDAVQKNDHSFITQTTKPVVAVVNTSDHAEWLDRMEQLNQIFLKKDLEDIRKEALGPFINDPQVNNLLGFLPTEDTTQTSTQHQEK